MVTVKVRELVPLFLLNREVLGSADIKKSVESPLGVAINAQKNVKVLEAEIRKQNDNEEEIKKLASNKDADGKPVIINDGNGGKMYELTPETQEEFNKSMNDHANTLVELPLNKFSELVSEKIILHLKDEKGGRASDKTSLLIEYLTDIKS